MFTKIYVKLILDTYCEIDRVILSDEDVPH